MTDVLQARYNGYLNTPLLWNKNSINDLEQLQLSEKSKSNFFKKKINEIRLGKLIEQFVFAELSFNKSIDIIATNIQLIDHKLTIGELDCLIKFLNEYIHLEIIYKFYLYDPNIITSEIDKWIGPNRNDSLSKKIKKLKTKQLPILFHKKTKELLNKYDLDVDLFTQKVYFKAQLFVPFNLLNKKMEIINNQCIKGYYLNFKEIQELNYALFYIPSKLDWLIEPSNNVRWEEKTSFLIKISTYMKAGKSPLCWLKDNKGDLCKIFVVFWS